MELKSSILLSLASLGLIAGSQNIEKSPNIATKQTALYCYFSYEHFPPLKIKMPPDENSVIVPMNFRDPIGEICFKITREDLEKLKNLGTFNIKVKIRNIQ